jgi:ABC-2 type transport system permease protein
MKALTGFRTLVWREIYRFISVFKQTITPPLVSSFLYIFTFGFSIGRHIDMDGMPYLTFLIPGLLMMHAIEGSYQNTSSSLFISRWANNIEELLVTPISYFEMVLAILIGGLARSVVIVAGVWGISLFFVKLLPAHFWIMAYFLVFVALIFSLIGMLVALYAEEFEHLTTVTTFVISPLVFFGGVFNTLDMVPGPLQTVLKLNPIFYMVNGMRYGMLGQSDAPVGLSMALVMALFLILFSVTVHLFKAGYKLRK